MPLYVPAGHWFVFDLGRRIAERFGLTNRRGAFYLLAPFVPATAAMAWAGVDTSGVVLLSLMLAFTAWGPAPMLCARYSRRDSKCRSRPRDPVFPGAGTP